MTAALLVLSAGLPDRAGAGALYIDEAGHPVAAAVGAVAPPLDLTALDGGRVRLDAYRGRAVVVNFWATWCAPCRVEMPALQAISDRYPERVAVLGVNGGEPAAAVAAWRDELGLTFPLLLDPDGAAARDYRLRGQPTTVIVAPDGRVSELIYGPADVAALERAVTALVPPPDERTSP